MTHLLNTRALRLKTPMQMVSPPIYHSEHSGIDDLTTGTDVHATFGTCLNIPKIIGHLAAVRITLTSVMRRAFAS